MGVTITAGVKAEVGIIGLPEGFRGKTGIFVKVGADGVRDVGISGETSVTRGFGPVAVEDTTGGFEYSFLPSPGTSLN